MILTLTINPHECPNCHMAFGITERFENDRRTDHQNFYCPQGHSMSYNYETKEEKLQRELNQALLQKDREANEKRRAYTQLYATKGQLTKVMNRIEKGVCPKCNRTFFDLHEHMKTKHAMITPRAGK